MGGFAWVTLATNDSYSLGALVLAHSLRRAGTKHDLAILITPGVTQVMREKLASVYSLVQEVNVLDSKDEANLALLARPELGITFTKLHCWRLTQYEKCVFVDADALVVRNCDELFEREELTAAPDVGWPDCFNSGVFVFKPSQQTFASITSFAAEKGSFDGGDQGLLNSYFSDWAHKDISKHLPFIYNMCSTATYSYLPAYKQFGENVRIIHFIGATKPWLQYFDTETSTVHPPSGCNHLQPLLQLWWNIFCENVYPKLSPVMARSTLASIWHRFTPPLPSTSVPWYPICNESNQSHSYRSESRKSNYNYEDDIAKPADFSEFNDPWEQYIPNYTPPENLDYHHQRDHTLQYYNTGPHEFNDSQSSQQFQNYAFDNPPQQLQRHDRLSVDNPQQPTPSVNLDAYSLTSQHREFDENLNENRNQNYHNPWQSENDYQHVQKQSTEAYHSPNLRRETFVDNTGDFRVPKNFEDVNNEIWRESQTEHSEHFREQTSRENIDDRLHRDHYFRHDPEEPNDSIREEQTNDRLDDFHSVREVESIRSIDATPHSQSEFPSNHEPCTDPPHNVAQHYEQSVDNQGQPAVDDAGIAGALAKMTLGEPRSAEQVALEEHMRRQGWEQGQIDYMGRDSFDNIWKKILSTISQPPEHQPSPSMETQNVEISSPVVPSSPLAATSSSIAVCTTPDVSSPSIPSGESVATLHSNDVIEFLKSEPIVEPLTVRDEPKLPEEPKSVEPDVEAKSVVGKSQPEEKIPTEFAAEELKVTTQTVQSSPVSTKVPLPESAETKPLTKKTVEVLQTSPALPKVEPPENIEPVLSKPETATSEILIQPSSIFSEGQSPAEKIMTGQVSSSAASEVEPFANIEPVPPSNPETATSEFPKPSSISLHAKKETDPVSETKLEEFVSTFEVPKSVVKESSAVLEAETTESKAKPSAALAVSGTSLISGTELGTESATSELTELILDSSSVPIQVAESVLQSEPKESVSEDQRPVTEEAISSVVAPVLETATAVSETVAEAKAAEESKAAGNSFRNGVGSAITPLEIPAQIPEPEIPADIPEPKIPADIPEPEIPAPVKIEPLAAAAQEAEISGEESSKSASLTPPDSPGTTVPVRPIRTKDSRIPTTPIVTEATPPNSPPIGGVESLEDQPLKSVKKVVKKVVKKAPADVEGAEGAADSETVGKKVVKKVVKKIVKKPKEETDDGAETSSAATEKPKKTVKMVKKVVKPSESLEVDASIPDTPPVGEVPVPPRRKTKTTTTTTTKTTTTSGKSPAAEEAAKPSESKS
ncbi:titin isoform X1 [Neodiprion pinetum]|uniref:titin isoform X1 n=1 Tax=Neodiprion pinetum TaxID=441929 RepID=UPI001EE08D37|nr:titin isoform X1 [Neodiprion pinetum]